jgi:hypothetical protein
MTRPARPWKQNFGMINSALGRPRWMSLQVLRELAHDCGHDGILPFFV